MPSTSWPRWSRRRCSTAWVSSTKMAGAAGGGVLGSAWGVRATPGLMVTHGDASHSGGRACRDNGYTYRVVGTAPWRAWSRALRPRPVVCPNSITTPSRVHGRICRDTISRIRGSSCTLTARPETLVADTGIARRLPSQATAPKHRTNVQLWMYLSLNKQLTWILTGDRGVRPTKSRRPTKVLPAMRVTGRLLSAPSLATLDRRGAFGRHFGDVGGRLGTVRSEGGLLSTLTSCRGGYFQRV